MEFRWKLIGNREVLQVKNILKPTNSVFSSRNFETNWSTLYGFTASSSFYSLSHDTWPDAAVSSSYSHGVVNFDGLTISFGEEETKDGVTYQQLQLNAHSASTEWIPSASVSNPAKLFVFVGDNGNPNESALLTNSAWPVITKKLDPTPTPVEPTPSPVADCDCADDGMESVTIKNVMASAFNGTLTDFQLQAWFLCRPQH